MSVWPEMKLTMLRCVHSKQREFKDDGEVKFWKVADLHIVIGQE